MRPVVPINLFGTYNGGLNTRDDPRTLPLHKSPYLKNVELRRNRVETTPGYTAHAGTDADTAANLGLFVARYGGNVYLLKGEGGKIKKLKVVGSSPDSSWVELKTGLNSSARVEFAQANNVVYAVNGVNTCQKWDLATAPANTSDAAGVPLAKTIAYFNQRLCTSNGDRLDFSSIGAYETFSGYKYADQGEGGTIQRLLDTGRGQLLIMKDPQGGRYTWDGVDTSTSNPKKWSDRGTIAPRSVVVMPSGQIVFCDYEGVWIASVYEYGERMLSDEIAPTWAALNSSKLSEAAAIYFDDQYLISVTSSDGSVNNLTLVFDTQLDGGSGGWLQHDIGATAWAIYLDSSGDLQLIFGAPTAISKLYVRYKGTESTHFNFNGAVIAAEYWTAEIDGHQFLQGVEGKIKHWIRKRASLEASGDYSITLGYRKDQDDDFSDQAFSLAGVATSLWDDNATDLWDDNATDVWEGQSKTEIAVDAFSLRGRTVQSKIALSGINQPFVYFGELFHMIPLKGFS